MKVLITGFGVFHNFSVNPTALLVQKITNLPEITLKKIVFDVNFEQVAQTYQAELIAFDPDLIINLGLNASAKTIELEEFALNTAAPDQIIIMENGPAAYRSKLPLRELSIFLNKQGVPTQVSHHAGTFLCNFIYYHSLYYMQQKNGHAVFVHMPFSSELVCDFALQNQPIYSSLPMAILEKAVELLVQAIKSGDA